VGYIYLTLAVLSTSFGQLLFKQNAPLLGKKVSTSLIISIFLLVSVPFYIYLSLQYINFAIVFLSDAISIIIIVVFSKFFLKEYLNSKKLIGIFFILIGICILNWKAI
jgi:multidrug transporter EmrE-like cation transporter